jgi:protein-tyrosine-phosphatase
MKIILFVCTANIARSPMAQTLFNKKIQDIEMDFHFRAESAGTWAVDGIPAPPDGQKVMREQNLDTSMHRSRGITNQIVENADLILTMEAGHKEALQIEFPEKRNKIFMITEMVGSQYDIIDPYKRGLDAFEQTAQELNSILDQGISKIFELAGGTE